MKTSPFDCTQDLTAATLRPALLALGLEAGLYASLIIWEDDEMGTLIVSDPDEAVSSVEGPDGETFEDRTSRDDWMLITGCDGNVDAVCVELAKQLEAHL